LCEAENWFLIIISYRLRVFYTKELFEFKEEKEEEAGMWRN
jgi:hypothetical protein